MPGGLLSHGIYQKLGGTLEFGPFWRTLGLPTLAVLALCYGLLVSRQIVSQKTWIIGSIGLVASMAAAVYLRVIH